MLLSAVSILVVAQSSSEIPEELMNNSVCVCVYIYIYCTENCNFKYRISQDYVNTNGLWYHLFPAKCVSGL
jgi:hypothetical protein